MILLGTMKVQGRQRLVRRATDTPTRREKRPQVALQDHADDRGFDAWCTEMRSRAQVRNLRNFAKKNQKSPILLTLIP